MHGFDQSDQNTWLDRGGNRRLIGSSSSSNLFLFQSSVYRVDCRRVGLDQIKSLERGGSICLIGLGSNSCTSCKCQQSDEECLKDTSSSRRTHSDRITNTSTMQHTRSLVCYEEKHGSPVKNSSFQNVLQLGTAAL